MALDFNQLKQLRFAQLRDYFTSLSKREQYIVAGTAGGVLFILLIIIATTFFSAISRLEGRIDKNREVLQEIQRLRGTYQQSKQLVEQLETTMRQAPPGFSLTSHLETVAQQFRVNTDSMSPKPVPPNDLYFETQVEVRVQKIMLPALVDYLHAIESTPGVLRLNSLSVKSNYTDPAYLNVSFTVSSFSAR